MMKYFLAVFFTFVLLSSQGQAHDPNMQKNMVVMNSRMTPNSLVRTRPKPKESLRGSPFLFLEPKKGVVKIKNLPNKDYAFEKMRYDAYSHEIEVSVDNQLRFIRGIDLTAFMLKHEGQKLYFINAEKYDYKGSKLYGFFQLLEDGALQVLKRVRVQILASNYSIALNVGHNYDQLIRKTEYYFARKGVLQMVKSRKEVYRFFSKLDFDAKSFMKQNKLKYRKNKENTLRQLVRAYNSNTLINK